MSGDARNPTLASTRSLIVPNDDCESAVHRGALSWITSANGVRSDFPLANLPFCVFALPSDSGKRKIGVGIGRFVLDLGAVAEAGLLGELASDVSAGCRAQELNRLFGMGRETVRELRSALTMLLAQDSPLRERERDSVEKLLYAQKDVVFELPFVVGDYTDFLTSLNHATNVGRLYRPDNPVLPNFSSLPVAYHGRASSLIPSGVDFIRPQGQYRQGHGGAVTFGPTCKLDLEVEIGLFIGRGNALGTTIPIEEADAHVAGLCLLNDWSARDIQAWESQPLGPFLGKSFATSVGSWVVTLDALEPYRTAPAARQSEADPLLPYLHDALDQSVGAFEIHLDTWLLTGAMREAGAEPTLISSAEFSRDCYWTFAQMIAHHTVNGCNLRCGDLLGSGTISGPYAGSEGSLLELTKGGSAPLTVGHGESRTFLQDGDEITITAYCARADDPAVPRIGFGECRARVVEAATASSHSNVN
jgi:fumarylacetoacetase